MVVSNAVSLQKATTSLGSKKRGKKKAKNSIEIIPKTLENREEEGKQHRG